jgi:hypothetical protein
VKIKLEQRTLEGNQPSNEDTHLLVANKELEKLWNRADKPESVEQSHQWWPEASC